MNHRLRLLLSLLSLCLSACQSTSPEKAGPAAAGGPVRVYVGTYTNAKSKGVFVMEMDPRTGSLTEPKLAAATPSPSYLALHPNKKYLYAVNEVDTFNGQKTGSVSAFRVNSDGTLAPLNGQSSGGPGPCHLDLDGNGKSLIVANYAGGSVASYRVGDDGSLSAPVSVIQHEGASVDRQRQQGPHAHCVLVEPWAGGSRALVADLGLDKVMIYRLDASNATLTPNDPPSGAAARGSGPRHLALGRGGNFLYVNNEMKSTVTTYSYDRARGALTSLQTLSTLPEGYDGSKNSTAEIAVHPSGKFVYVSNRGHDSIAVFKVDSRSGQLSAAGHQSTQGKTPRGFAVAPGGRFLLAANQNSDTVVVFRIDENNGALTPTGTTASVPSPVCVTFLAR
jgi:6-phosphogluconolactonase